MVVSLLGVSYKVVTKVVKFVTSLVKFVRVSE